jgi:hypothetical protein
VVVQRAHQEPGRPRLLRRTPRCRRQPQRRPASPGQQAPRPTPPLPPHPPALRRDPRLDDLPPKRPRRGVTSYSRGVSRSLSRPVDGSALGEDTQLHQRARVSDVRPKARLTIPPVGGPRPSPPAGSRPATPPGVRPLVRDVLPGQPSATRGTEAGGIGLERVTLTSVTLFVVFAVWLVLSLVVGLAAPTLVDERLAHRRRVARERSGC